MHRDVTSAGTGGTCACYYVAMNHLLTLMAVAVVLATTFTLGQFLVVASGTELSAHQTASVVFAQPPVPESVTAKSVYVFDVETGMELSAKDADTARPIASITKLFSSAAFYNQGDLEREVVVTEGDIATEGVAGRLKVGQSYTARELLFPALLESSNDASVAQARVSEHDLILSMYAFARRYDATDVSFFDTSGLSSQNVASARSLGRLATALFMEEPQLFDITRLKQYVASETTWLNNSPFITMSGYRGGKHGYTNEANRTAVAFFNETMSDGRERLIGYVLLGSDDLRGDMLQLRAVVVGG